MMKTSMKTNTCPRTGDVIVVDNDSIIVSNPVPVREDWTTLLGAGSDAGASDKELVVERRKPKWFR